MLRRSLILTALMTAAAIPAAESAFAWDCNADCDQASRSSYPCPTFRNPRRRCPMTDHFTRSACILQKEASCKLWNEVAEGIAGKMRPYLEGQFNAATWRDAEEKHEEDKYMLLCQGAGIAACGALGAELGATWGAVVGGAGGAFASYKVCLQSKSW